ncbi:MAG: hypothetical protein RBR09_01490 [Desulfobulbaceae bacterium]|jgi:hypothetical protein|nr:hypothetical protein [Deltaproteobacteria bacterium]MDY0349901.1 hypothetical protein [Desulfobulbaceae bacterium]
MKTLLEKFQKLAMAVTYAEAGEWDTAREMLPESKPRTSLNWVESHFAAVAFAEAGLREEAVNLTSGRGVCSTLGRDMCESLGLRGVHLSFGYVTVN